MEDGDVPSAVRSTKKQLLNLLYTFQLIVYVVYRRPLNSLLLLLTTWLDSNLYNVLKNSVRAHLSGSTVRTEYDFDTRIGIAYTSTRLVGAQLFFLQYDFAKRVVTSFFSVKLDSIVRDVPNYCKHGTI